MGRDKKKQINVEIDCYEFVIDTMYLMIKHIIGKKQAEEFRKLNK